MISDLRFASFKGNPVENNEEIIMIIVYTPQWILSVILVLNLVLVDPILLLSFRFLGAWSSQQMIRSNNLVLLSSLFNNLPRCRIVSSRNQPSINRYLYLLIKNRKVSSADQPSINRYLNMIVKIDKFPVKINHLNRYLYLIIRNRKVSSGDQPSTYIYYIW